MISHEHKFIFIFPPKTGSTSLVSSLMKHANIRRVIEQKEMNSFDFFENEDDYSIDKWAQFTNNRKRQERKHASLSSYHDYHIKNYILCMSVRNPYDRILSLFKWNLNVTGRNHVSFKTWLLQRTKRWANKPQVDFLNNGIINTNKINLVRFETLQQDFDVICDKIGIPKHKLEHKNKTDHKHYTEYYDDETRELVAQQYAKDLEFFGYEFGT